MNVVGLGSGLQINLLWSGLQIVSNKTVLVPRFTTEKHKIQMENGPRRGGTKQHKLGSGEIWFRLHWKKAHKGTSSNTMGIPPSLRLVTPFLGSDISWGPDFKVIQIQLLELIKI